MFNPRQLLGLELSCRLISEIDDDRIRHALATNLSDLLRYQNMLCRYDTMALKSLDIFSIHGFPVGLVQCESNLLGIVNATGANVGSGGWSNILTKYVRAKDYCDAPYEVRHRGLRKIRIPIEGERIAERVNGASRRVAIHCGSATESALPANSLDAVFTDPPYFGNVQYGELMDFCYVWLRRLIGKDAKGFAYLSARSPDELTGNVTQERDLEHFTEGLSEVYSRMADAMKPGAPLVFTYHHNKLDAYCAVAGGDPGRRPCLHRILAVPRGDGRFDPYSRYWILDRRYRVRVPGILHGARALAVRVVGAAAGTRERGSPTPVGRRQDGHPRRYPMHRFGSPYADSGMAAPHRLGSSYYARPRRSPRCATVWGNTAILMSLRGCR